MTPANPFRTALKSIGIAGLAAGALLLIIGAGVFNAAVTDAQLYGSVADPTASGILVGIGGWLFGIGVAGLLLWFVVSSIGWDASIERPASASRTLAPEEIAALLDRKAERG